MAGEHIVVVKKKGPKPEIEFVIGNAQWGSYKLKIFTSQAKAWKDVGEGVNWDSVQDRFVIGPTATDLDGAFLRWTLAITPVQVGDPYSATVSVYQGGNVVDGGTLPHRGTTLLETHPVAGLVKVVAV